MKVSDRKVFYQRMSSIRAPSYFGALLGNAFTKDNKFAGLKSHDFYNIIRFHLPLAIRGLVSPQVQESVFRLSRYMRYVCMKNISALLIEKLEKEAAVVVCLLQMQFPSSFFDSQQHLLVHLAREVRLAGPVQGRWMFPVERHIKVLKAFVRQKARPEGSVAAGYLIQEKTRVFREILENFGGEDLRAWNEEPEDMSKGMPTFNTLHHVNWEKSTCHLVTLISFDFGVIDLYVFVLIALSLIPHYLVSYTFTPLNHSLSATVLLCHLGSLIPSLPLHHSITPSLLLLYSHFTLSFTFLIPPIALPHFRFLSLTPSLLLPHSLSLTLALSLLHSHIITLTQGLSRSLLPLIFHLLFSFFHSFFFTPSLSHHHSLTLTPSLPYYHSFTISLFLS
jgi:hypothetical protein